ncbi:glutathione S-transferase family protein [Conexibacter sp. CPCC 206217]|uniref:glutathione S-transferase family protein n=1 Tax=Conexibacter sp. CPCC 206217 TaxID=3064574 RepID=UPI0027181777|nr:glutathione S-transferase family protein [Conexibacter sp. CPCC 206217]MDO8209939.1 glutathione S-transferase family protein [Conexibacter sp. CPCC 206217]
MSDTAASCAVQFPKESDARGAFVRQQSRFRDWVTADGSSPYPAEPGRYHLYISLACPWASRTLIVRNLKRLQDVIDVTVVDPLRDERGWRFTAEEPDPVNGFEYVAQAYAASDPAFDGRVTVPVLWDKRTGRIVNNESADIIRMLNSAFDEWGDASVDLYPQALRSEIDPLNERIYATVNNGVYRAGFAGSQEAYEEAFDALFETLDVLDERLAGRRYLTGDQITEADWRLFVTLVRFDAVYVGHFKCNLRRIADYPNLSGYVRDLYQQPGIAQTVDFDHIKRHYYMTHPQLNPSRIVPKGPALDFDAPHDRARLAA